MKKNYVLLPLLFLIFTIYLQGQSSSEKERKKSTNWSVHVKYGLPFYSIEEPTYSSFETKIQHNPSYHITAGLGYQYYVLKRLSIKAGASYEQNRFSKLEEFSYVAFNGEYWEVAIKDDFRTHTLSHPIQLYYHLNPFSVSIGFTPMFHAASIVDVNKKYWIDGTFVEEEKSRYKDGDDYASGHDQITVGLDKKRDFQFSLGLQFRVLRNFLLEVEVLQNTFNNQLVKNHFHHDAGDYFEYFNPYPNRFLKLGLNYDLLPKKN